jgi:hypothetical protein
MFSDSNGYPMAKVLVETMQSDSARDQDVMLYTRPLHCFGSVPHYPIDDDYSPARMRHLIARPRGPAVKAFIERLRAVAVQRAPVNTDVCLRAQMINIFMKNDLAHGDGDGNLDRHELHDFCSKTLNIPMEEKDLNVIFKYFDEDGGGYVTIEEFIDGVMAHTPRPTSVSTVNSSGRSVGRSTGRGLAAAGGSSMTMPTGRTVDKKRVKQMSKKQMAELKASIRTGASKVLKDCSREILQLQTDLKSETAKREAADRKLQTMQQSLTSRSRGVQRA